MIHEGQEVRKGYLKGLMKTSSGLNNSCNFFCRKKAQKTQNRLIFPFAYFVTFCGQIALEVGSKHGVLSALPLIVLFLNSPVFSQDSVRVLVVYYSVEGHTRLMGEAVARGAREVPGTQVKLAPVSQATSEDVLWADGIVVGSPVYNAAVAPEVQKFINGWPFEGAPMRNKVGAAFATGGGISAGEEVVQLNILHSMLIFGMVVVGGPEWSSSFGASAITGEGPFLSKEGKVDSLFLKKGEALGKRVAELAGTIRRK